MAYKHNIVPGHEALLDEIRRYCTRWPDNQLPAFVGAGNGRLWLRPTVNTAPVETWTVTCATAPSPGNETWTVSGGTSGAQASATTGVAYDNGVVKIDIQAGVTDFQVGDQFTVDIIAAPLAATEEWTEHRYDLGVETAGENKLILEGQGLDTTKQIFVGFKSFFNEPSDYYNLGTYGMSGYNAGVDLELQPGLGSMGEVPLFDTQLEYWMIVNGQRIAVAIKVETVFSSFYVGFPFPYATPGEYPYPLVNIGMLTGQNGTRYDAAFEMGFKGSPNHCYIRDAGGTWISCKTLPYQDLWMNGSSMRLRDTPPNDYPLIPITLITDDPEVYGILDGVFFVPGFNNVVEDTITIGADTYLVMRSGSATGFNDYCAFKLE